MSKVLIVDDSPAQLLSLRRIVEQAGHEAVTAETAEQALQMVCEENPQLILMDIVMPGMNGYQATRRLSQNQSTSNIPVIMVTSRSTETDKAWGLRQGARNYLTKPVQPEALLSAMSEAMAA